MHKLASLSFDIPIGNGKGFLDQQWCPAEAATPVS
jgi:hypothetical protein